MLQEQRIKRRRVSSVLEVSPANEESKQAASNSRISNESEILRQIEEDKRQESDRRRFEIMMSQKPQNYDQVME